MGGLNMGWRVMVYAVSCLLLLLLVWWRRSPGRDFVDPPDDDFELSEIKSLRAFDEVHPHAKQEHRKLFYEGVQAQLNGDDQKARKAYKKLLEKIEDKLKVIAHNLNLLKE
jgi:hypothetical protein